MLWKFGNEYDGLLVIEAETAEEAVNLRDAWLVEQKEKDIVYRNWWKRVQSDPELWNKSWGVRNYILAEEKFGPIPESGITYFDLNMDETPISIGKVFAYMWSE